MNKVLTLLAATAGVAFATAALADEKAKIETKATTSIEQDSDSYEEKRELSQDSRDASGRLSNETTVKIEAEADGDAERTATTKMVEDPKGLGNKTRTVTKDTVKREDGQVTTKHTKKVNGKIVEEGEREQGLAPQQ
jgi:hypothetical protein